MSLGPDASCPVSAWAAAGIAGDGSCNKKLFKSTMTYLETIIFYSINKAKMVK